MTEKIKYCDLTTRLGFAVFTGVWLTCLLRLITWNAWLSVFVLSACLGIYTLENWNLMDEINDMKNNTNELEKQVVSLRSVIEKMCRLNSQLEVEKRRASIRPPSRQSLNRSTYSL